MMTAYHYTACEFEAFDDSKIGQIDGGFWGPGHYFYDNDMVSAEVIALRGWKFVMGCEITGNLMDLSDEVVTDELAAIYPACDMEVGEAIDTGAFEGDVDFRDSLEAAGFTGVIASNQVCVFRAVNVEIEYIEEA
jgi:hypothetical protein